MISLETISIQTAISLVLAILTAYLTVRFALQRFYREKWWEEKMRAYTDILQALHYMKRDLEISVAREMEGREETEYHEEWGVKHRAAWDEIRKQIDVGEFLFSVKSLSILQELLRKSPRTDPNESYFEHLERLQAAVTSCLPAIKVAAREDLGLPKHH